MTRSRACWPLRQPPFPGADLRPSRRTGARKDEVVRGIGDKMPVRPADVDKFLPLSHFPIDESNAHETGPARACADAIDEPSPCRRRPGTCASRRQDRDAQIHVKGQPLSSPRFSRRARPNAVRAVFRSDQRHRNLSGRPLHGTRPDGDRHLRRRLQHRLQPVLLLQRRARLPIPAVGEPAEGPDSRRRAAPQRRHRSLA